MKSSARYRIPMVVSFIAIVFIGSVAWADKGHEHVKQPAQADDAFFEGASKDNGYSIYLEGMTLKGERIAIDGGPHWLYMHGGGCASCHGDNGQGGFLPMMCGKKTPPITFKALMNDEHKHDGAGHKHAPYTIEKIRQALELSVNPAMESFDPCMPKWFLKDHDFRDLLFYLKSLDE